MILIKGKPNIISPVFKFISEFIFRYFILLSLPGGFFTQTSLAQFTDSTNHYVSYTSAGSLNKTNNGDAYLLNNVLKYQARKKSVSLNSTNSWIYGKQESSLTNNDFSTVLDFNLYKTLPHFYYWGLANYNTSYSLKINHQLLTGLGVAYNLVDRPEFLFNISDGILYDLSDLKIDEQTNNRYHTYRNSLRLLLRIKLKEVIIFDGTGFLQNSFFSQNDYIIKSNASLSFKLNRWLSLSTNLNYNKMNKTHSENLLLSYGFAAARYF